MTQDYKQVLKLFSIKSTALDFFIQKIQKTLHFYDYNGNKKKKKDETLKHIEPILYKPENFTYDTTELFEESPNANTFLTNVENAYIDTFKGEIDKIDDILTLINAIFLYTIMGVFNVQRCKRWNKGLKKLI